VRIRVKLFAVARELVGQPEAELDMGPNATIADFRRELLQQFPQLESVVVHARWAVDAEFADDTHAVAESSEVAIIPPVSGG
jgi:molybdopterin converting factor subunit 1